MIRFFFCSMLMGLAVAACTPATPQASEPPAAVAEPAASMDVTENVPAMAVEAEPEAPRPGPKTYPRYVLAEGEPYLEVMDMKIPVLDGLSIGYARLAKAGYFYPLVSKRGHGRQWLSEYSDIIRGFGFQPTHKQSLEVSEYVRYGEDDCKDRLMIYSSPAPLVGETDASWDTATHELISFRYIEAHCSTVEGPMSSGILFQKTNRTEIESSDYTLPALDGMFVATERYPDVGLDEIFWMMNPPGNGDMKAAYDRYFSSKGLTPTSKGMYGDLEDNQSAYEKNDESDCYTSILLSFSAEPVYERTAEDDPAKLYESLHLESREFCAADD